MIKKREINDVLVTLLFYKKEGEVQIESGGLLKEEMSLGLRRYLQNIRKELLTHHETLNKDSKEIVDAIKDKAVATLPDSVKKEEYLDEKGEHYAEFIKALEQFQPELEKEINDLLDEAITLIAPPASLDLIMKINTKVNYNFELIEKIAQ